jgi:hypothetical protein
MMTQPSRHVFWRFVFTALAILTALAGVGFIDRSQALNVSISQSSAWQGLFIALGSFFILMLVGIVLSYSRRGERLWVWLETFGQDSNVARWMGIVPVIVGVFGFIFISWNPFFKQTLGFANGPRFLLFFIFSLVGMCGLKLLRRNVPWLTALIAVVLVQSVLHLLLVYMPRVTSYPFAMGWSETSRFYYPSLFLSGHVYGMEYPWPILHPTLHLLLAPPYLLDAPLWFHRFWQVAIRYLLVAAIVPALLTRLKIRDLSTRWLVALWMFLFLFMGPVYFHLAIPVIIVLIGFSIHNDRRIWIAVLLASIWCGWSRVNWYPMPGMIAAVLYLMEVPVAGNSARRYLLKPASWFVIGTLTAFLSQRIYISLSGIPASELFYTSLSSDLLWNRLWPNASYFLGILPGALLASLPSWLAIFIVLRSRKTDWHPMRLFFIFAALFVLFAGGIIVSLKIGGGANLHNMDAYFTMLLIVLAYLVFTRNNRENGVETQPVVLPWFVVVLLLLMPVWAYTQFSLGTNSYDKVRTQSVLEKLQRYVDDVNEQGGEILFITQRHLISMHMLKGVTLVPEYEREDLMEMAMGNNLQYIDHFADDMENQRFALIVVDPLNYKLLPEDRSFAEENNVWVRRVMKHILCNYREEVVFAADEIALYVPQDGARQCP